jgi:thymidylate synthase
MRIYDNFIEAFSEIARDLKEMGVNHHTETMQDKDISEDPSFDTLELQNYIYTVITPRFSDLDPIQPWALAEWEERLSGIEGNAINPGIAWELRRDIWEEFLRDGKFDYTYSERFSRHLQVERIINRLREDSGSRQLYVAMWTQSDAVNLGKKRNPCSIGWLFQFRGGKLNMKYTMRSCDWATHFQNDVYLAMKLQHHVAHSAGMEPGHFCQDMGSLHVYKKDVADVF